MKVRFVKCIYEECEVDIPKEVIDECLYGTYEDTVIEYMKDAVKVGEEVEIDDIQFGELDYEDELYEARMHDEAVADYLILDRQYKEGLI